MNLESTIIYARGFRPYGEARVGLLTHGLQYGTGCFEGIRGYWDTAERELYLLMLREHYTRLHTSAKILMMKIPHTVDELVDMTVELCARNRFEADVYVRPVVYKANEDIGVRLHNVEDAFAIVPVPFVPYLDTAGGLDTCVSSWRRADDACAPARAKITGLYVNSALAKTEAQLSGFDEAILLSADGHVAEGSAENIFLVRDGTIFTPDPSQNILEGCTRRAIIRIATEEFGLTVVERSIDRSELYAAEEIFCTGTAAGVAWIASVDRRPVGNAKMGPITQRLSSFYERAIRGKEPRYRDWVTPVYAASQTRAVSA